MRVLVIEDEPSIAEAIRQGLEEEGFVVQTALDGKEGLRRIQDGVYGLVVLDVLLPGMDGWQICRRVRDDGNTVPILMLTACGSPSDRVRGLDTGADDFLSKPFHFAELVARIRALLRRDKLYRGRILHVGDLEIDTRSRIVKRAGKAVFLTPREYSLLEALAAREGHTITRTEILERIWMDDQSLDSYSNTVDVHIGQLRKKIDRDFPAKLIQTVRGVGYSLRRPNYGV
jgi:DNA-binding response OmpR family regulator